MYLLQNVATNGCLSINKNGLKLELTSCTGNEEKGIVMVPVTKEQYHTNRIKNSNITRRPVKLGRGFDVSGRIFKFSKSD